MSTPNISVANNPLNWSAFGPNGVTTNFAGTNGANPGSGWKWDLTAGKVALTDFFQFTGSILGGGQDRGALTITSSSIPAVQWLPVDVFNYAAVVVTSDLTLDIGTVNPASVDQVANGWTFRDQSTLYVNPIAPEPATLGMFGLLGLAGLAAGRRNRK
jgi:hypothetical protein